MIFVVSLLLLSISSANPVAWWKFDESPGSTTAQDSSVNGHDGTLTNMDPAGDWVTGRMNGALDFDGGNDHVLVTGYKGIIGSNPRTITAWIKTSNTSSIQAITSWGNNSNSAGKQWTFYLENGKLAVKVWSGKIIASTLVADGDWHHVACALASGGSLDDTQFFIDGYEDGIGSPGDQVINTESNADVSVGAAVNTSPGSGRRYFFNGLIDDVRIYDSNLSQPEILQISAGGIVTQATAPNPVYDDTDIPLDTILTWTPGEIATSHDVYFGTNYSEVADANSVSHPNVDYTNIDVNSYYPDDLVLKQTYYWRVDEVNDANNDLWPGSVWKFTAADNIPIDDFESYSDTNGLLTKWDDGTTNASGAVVSLGQETAKQYLKMDYNNNDSPYYSESTYVYTAEQDWLTTGAKLILMSLKGEPNNAPQNMYLTIEDANGNSFSVPTADINDTKLESWTHVYFDLKDFSDEGVDLRQVKKVTIGLENITPAPPSASGTIYIDHVKLYPPLCIAGLGPDIDSNGDCVIDGEDMKVLTDGWLASSYTAVAEAPDSNHLIAHYAFDETSGKTAYDGTSNNYHASIDTNDSNDLWDPNGYDANGCIYLDTVFVSIPNDVFDQINNEITVSIWVNADDEPNSLVEPINYEAGPPGSRDSLRWTPENKDAYANGWNHFAVIKDTSLGLMRLYHNGLLVKQNIEANQPLDGTQAGPTTIGDGVYKGKMDECRIYDYALSHDEIIYLALGEQGQLYQPMIPVFTSIDPVFDGVIDFKDYALMSKYWLNEPVWPTW